MRTFRPDQYFRPDSVNEAISILERYGIRAKVIAGGTELNELAKRGMAPHVLKLVDLERLGLNYVNSTGDLIRIGAMATIADLETEAAFRRAPACDALLEAIRGIRPVQVRNAATVGGAICSSLPFLDLPTSLLALDASVKVVGPKGERLLRIEELWLDYFLTSLRCGELVTEVQIPMFPSGTASAFEKFQITAEDLAIVNVAVRIGLHGQVVSEARIAFGGRGAARIPTRMRELERTLEGKPAQHELIDSVSAMAGGALNPISDHRASAEYRREIAGILLKKALVRATSEALSRA